MPTLDEAMHIALQHHQAGRLQAAEPIYQQVLAVDPSHAGAWHLLGVLAAQTGQWPTAVEHYERALNLAPTFAEAHCNLGNALKEQGRLDAAVSSYRRALDLKPDYAEGHNNLGNAFQDLGRFDDAVRSFRRALELRPDYAEAHNNLGLALQKQGQVAAAISSYRTALAFNSRLPVVHYNLGVALQQHGEKPAAAASYRQAIELNPGFLLAYINLGTALQQQKLFDEAIATYRRAIELQPDCVDAHYNLGIAQAEQGQHEAAVASFRRTLECKADYAEAHQSLGMALYNLQRWDEAADAFRRALQIRPSYAAAHNELGRTLAAQKQTEAAAACYRRALELAPDLADAHNNLGNALRVLGQAEAALACFRRTLELDPGYAEAHSNWGIVLKERGEWDAAEDHYRRALELKPDYAGAHNNLGNVLKETGKLDEALACYRRALELSPDFIEAQLNLGCVLQDQGRLDSAEECYRRALELRPDFPDVHCGRAVLALLAGDLSTGWREYEWRWQTPEFAKRHLAQALRPEGQPAWRGEPLAGKTILLQAEQGLGDTIQFVRYAALLQAQGARTAVECQPALRRLLEHCPGIDELVDLGSPRPAYDFYCPLLSVPHVLGTTLATVPASIPYLAAVPALTERWRHVLQGVSGIRIGIAWQGSSEHKRDRFRSVPLRCFAPLARCPGVTLFSLQKGAGAEQTEALTDFRVQELRDPETHGMIDEATGPFLDTAAIMQSLDLVVTIDSSLAHLAGALGVPVWVAVPSVPDWRWLLDRDDTPWYPTMRLFRQARGGDWNDVFERMAAALQARKSHSSAAFSSSAQVSGPAPMERHELPTVVPAADIAAALARAVQHHQAGRLAAAQQTYREILAADPRNVNALHLLGVAMSQSGQQDQAEEFIRRAIDFEAGVADFHNNLGNVLVARGNLAAGIASYRQALELNPGYADAYNNLGSALRSDGDLDAAEASYRRSLQLAPDNPLAHNGLGTVHQQRGAMDAALASYRRALELAPHAADIHNNFGTALQKIGQFDAAIAAYRRAIELKPDYAEAHNHLGIAYQHELQYEVAATCNRRAVDLNPNRGEFHSELGVALQQLGQFDAALVSFARAKELKPDLARAHLNHALLKLLKGEFADGWPGYEWRQQAEERPERTWNRPRWQGEPIAGKTILLHTEQGLGDTIQFIRFVTQVKQRGARTIVEFQPALASLLRGCSGIDQLVPAGSPLPDFDVQAPLMSLPGILGITLPTIPASIPYLHVDPQLKAEWEQVLGNVPGLKVGISWQGNPSYKGDRLRSFPLRHLEPLARCAGVSLVSLQKYVGVDQLQNLAGRFPVVDLGPRFSEAPGGFLDTAAVMQNLDLIVTSDTAIAHVAGALGLPVWVALPFVSDWRWLLGRDDSPWYPTVRLFRQRRAGDWDEVFQRMAAALATMTPHSAAPRPHQSAPVRQEYLANVPVASAPAANKLSASELAAALASAVQQHQAGSFLAAEQIYRQILASDPANINALHLLGVVASQSGRQADAEDFIRRAIQLDPRVSDFHNNLGNVLNARGKFDEGIACYRRALELDPGYVDARNNLNSALEAQRQRAPAPSAPAPGLGAGVPGPGASVVNPVANSAPPVPAFDPHQAQRNADAMMEGIQHHQAGRLQAAEQIYRQVLASDARHAGAWHLLGVLAAQAGQLDTAITQYLKALELAPDFAEAHNNLGNALKDMRLFDQAIASYRRALEINPTLAEAHNNLGNALKDQGHLEQAILSYRRALEIRPDYADAHNNLGFAQQDLGEIDLALASYHRARDLAPQSALIHYNLGAALQQLSQYEGALASYARSLELDPNIASAHFNRSLLHLLQGDYVRGWPEFEWRWRTAGLQARPFSQPQWQGESLAGKTILLHAEQGLGDTIQFIRFAPLVKQRGATVIVECQRAVRALLDGCAGVDQFVTAGSSLPAFDVHAPLMSLAGILGTTIATIPADIPYVHADSQLVERWRQSLAHIPGIKIGICWQGSAGYKRDRLRSIPLAQFEPLARIPGVSLFSLQKGEGEEQLRAAPPAFHVHDLGSSLDETSGPFLDTAAVIRNLDLVVTVDTAIAHLAGALGANTWVPVPWVPDWRWLLDRNDSPWYPTLRLFRQEREGDWGGVFRRIAEALQSRV